MTYLNPVVAIHTADPTPPNTTARPENAIPYIFVGPLSTSLSPPIRPHVNLRVSGLSGTLGTASTGVTTVGLVKNGVVAATLTIPASSTYAYVSFDAVTFAARTDNLQLQLTASGGSDLGGGDRTLVNSTGSIGEQYIVPMLGEMFGSAHASWAPDTFYAYLGTGMLGSGTDYYSATVAIPNDDAHWLSTDGLSTPFIGTGVYNVQPLVFSAVTSDDLAIWDNTGISITLFDAAGTLVEGFVSGANIVIQALNASLTVPPFVVTPYVGLTITIAAVNLFFEL